MPDSFKSRLIEAHTLGSQFMDSSGIDPEPIETALMVEEHRWFWKPKRIKFILVAESHVRTTAKEVKVLIDPSRLPKNMPKESPLNFVKLVYCMGYGAPSVLTKPEQIENNAGTSQYVNLFRDLCNFTQARYSPPLQDKLAVLLAFKAAGIWLLDASVHACYFGKRERLPEDIVNYVVLKSWDKYVRTIIDDTGIDPSNVWFVGKTTHNLVRGKYVNDFNWIYQPNAKVSSDLREPRIRVLRNAIQKAQKDHI